MTQAERDAAHQRIAGQFAPCQPHFCIPTVAELPTVIDTINARLARGERP